MIYKPGILHEKFQREHFFFINGDFVWINCDKRLRDFSVISDWDDFTSTVNLKYGDIISLRFFKPSDQSPPYCYLEYVMSGDIKSVYKTESTISLSFLEHNLDNGRLFLNANKIVDRDRKINSLGI